MKITITEEKPIPPPKKVTLELTEDEAGLIRYFADYYNDIYTRVTDFDTSACAAARLRDQIPKEFWLNAKYPHTDAFSQSK